MLKTTLQYLRFIVFMFFGLTTLHAVSQNTEAKIHCVSFTDVDTIEITWAKIDSAFDSYILDYSPNNFSNWVQILNTTNNNTTIFRHAVDNSLEQHNYRLRNGNIDTSLARAITFRNGEGDSIVTNSSVLFKWYQIFLDTTETEYFIQRRFDGGNWEFMTSQNYTTYSDTIRTCDSTEVDFRVYVESEASCTSYSEFFSYLQAPYPLPATYPDTISVLDNDMLCASWVPLDLGYVNGYYIRKKTVNNEYLTIDSVEGGLTTYWESAINSNINFNNGSVPILITARKSCGGTNISDINLLETIYLQEPEVNICERSMSLNWSNYNFYKAELSGYKVIAYENEDLFKDTITSQTSYLVKGLNDNSDYKVFVRAIDVTGTKSSSSNLQQISFNYPEVTDSILLFTPNIIDDESAEISFSSFPEGIPSSYFILRADEEFGDYEVVDSVILTSDNNFMFTDNSVDFDAMQYYYRINIDDSCLSNIYQSYSVPTINLKGETSSRQYNSLNWNNVDSDINKVLSYNIFRRIDGTLNPGEPIQSLEDLSFEDDLFSYDDFLDFAAGEGYFEYYIEAEVITKGQTYTVRSNLLELEQLTEIFIPNAFAPNGSNPVFKPVSIFIKDEGYSLYIYNKWGELVFESHDKNDGWDGTCEGKAMPQDAYAYYIKYKDSAGTQREKKGILTLIR